MTAEQYAEYLKRKGKRRGKYNAKKVFVDGGISFDSKAEAKRYTELLLLRRAGEIIGFCRQAVFNLPGGIRYKADFVVWDKSKTWIEDVKGFKTKEYELKKKLMQSIGYEIVEIR